VSTRTWDLLFVGTAIFGALVCARYYVLAVLDKDRLLSRTAALGFFLLSIVAVPYFWRFL